MLNKRIKMLLVLVLIANLNVTAQIRKVEIIATGLTCSMCSNAITKQLKTMPGIDSIATDLNTNSFVVYLNKGNIIKPIDLKENVEKAGFFIGSMILTMSFNNLKVTENIELISQGLTFCLVGVKSEYLNVESRVKILDKGFITLREYKKSEKQFSKFPAYDKGGRVYYHVKIL